MDFVHLHAHSSYSLLQGAMTPQELVAAADGMGLPAVALTDTNGLYGAVLFSQAARAAGVRPIVGAEVVYGGEQAVLLAADRQGYANVCRIVTERKLNGTKHQDGSGFRVPGSRSKQGGTATDVEGVQRSTFSVQRYGNDNRAKTAVDVSIRNLPAEASAKAGPQSAIRNVFDIASAVRRDPRGLFVLTASPALLRRLVGVVPPGRLYAELRADDAHSFETRCPAICGASVACGMKNAPRGAEAVTIADLAERLGVPLVASVNANFLTPEERPTHAVLSAIRENVPVKALPAQWPARAATTWRPRRWPVACRPPCGARPWPTRAASPSSASWRWTPACPTSPVPTWRPARGPATSCGRRPTRARAAGTARP